MGGAQRKKAGDGQRRQPRKRTASVSGPLDALVARKVDLALTRLRESGQLTGEPSRKLSVRVDPGLIAAVADRIGVDNPTEIVTTALALLASPDPFVQWFATTEDRLPEDFEIAV